MNENGKPLRGILQPSTEYLDIEAINRELQDKLDDRDMAVIFVWFGNYGFTRKEVALALNLSEDGLKSRISRIYGKLEANSREEAVRRVMEILKVI